MKKAPTLQDVANYAKVSTATVSNVINNTKPVRSGTKLRVLEAIEKLDYIPNDLAKSLKVQDTKLIGLLISDIANPFFPPVVRGIGDYLAANGYNILLSETSGNLELEKANLRALIGRRIEGLIVSLATAEEQHFERIKTPLVFFNRVPTNENCNKVSFKNFEAGYIATKHLIEHGYKKIALIAGPQDLNVGRERLRGYEEAFKESNLEINPLFIEESDFVVEQGYEAMKKIMERTIRPEAVFACNYALTLGALQYLKENNIKIPDDIAFVGYDEAPWSTIIESPLTLIRFPLHEMGVTIGKMILNRITEEESGNEFESYDMEPELVVRQSCGCI
jgi:LacI family transcriptional regulator